METKPDLSGRPLVATRVDEPLFVDREEELKRVRASLQRRSNTLIHGERGAGKTSFLHRVEPIAHELGMDSVYVDASPAETVTTLIGLVRWRLGLGPVIDPVAATAASLASKDVHGVPEETIPLLRTLADEDSPPLRAVLLDEPQRHVAQGLFGRLRDEVWQLPYVWVVSVDEDALPVVLQPPADAFFGTQIEIGPLSREDSIEFLRRRIGSERSTSTRDLTQLADAAEGSPRRLIELAREFVIEGRQPAEIVARRSESDAALGPLGTPARRMVEVLRDRGSVSASDEDVLERLGWTRNRATQVLNQLQKAGFVTASREKGGRRKIYTLTPRNA